MSPRQKATFTDDYEAIWAAPYRVAPSEPRTPRTKPEIALLEIDRVFAAGMC